ncbi:MAG: ABC transporter permease [Chloroflexi bacterium]|nr:MAG: ABC transporter permease [Chloroflexota bacterium]MBL1197130.1 ABC transporter permease [Chloroflexota bacterium]NOH14425.1 ABC transporter permease [Chloroflexota bacterium]
MATTAETFDTPVSQDYGSNSLLRLTLRRLFKQRNALIGMVILLFLVLVATFAPIIAPHSPTVDFIGVEGAEKRGDPCIYLLGCSRDKPQHIMGLDGNFRDQFSRLIFGTRVSLFIGFTTIGAAVIVGTLIGSVSGYIGGWFDNIVMRFMDVILAFPSFLLAIAIITVLGRGLQNALYAIAIVNIPVFARLVRASVLSIKEQEYVSASRALGANSFRLLFIRILPNALPPLIVQSTLSIAGAILEAAALSFLGLGAQPPTPEWGTMLGSERNQVFTAPHLVFYPGLAIMFTVLAFNLLGDGLRDALDPRLVQKGSG